MTARSTRCELFMRMSLHSIISVSMSVTWVCPARMAKLIKMQFVGTLARDHVLDRAYMTATWQIGLGDPSSAVMWAAANFTVAARFCIHTYTVRNVAAAATGGQIDGQSSSDPVRNVSGIYIKHVKPDSPAGASGLLKDGDRILEVRVCRFIEINGSSLYKVRKAKSLKWHKLK